MNSPMNLGEFVVACVLSYGVTGLNRERDLGSATDCKAARIVRALNAGCEQVQVGGLRRLKIVHILSSWHGLQFLSNTAVATYCCSSVETGVEPSSGVYKSTYVLYR